MHSICSSRGLISDDLKPVLDQVAQTGSVSRVNQDPITEENSLTRVPRTAEQSQRVPPVPIPPDEFAALWPSI